MGQALRAVRGMNDILPAQSSGWRALEQGFRAWAERYGFGEIRTPLVEPTALFGRSIGDGTDIVDKEMYSFVDKGEHALTLRPEGTASVVRAFVQHKLYALEPVTKLYYLGPMYRRERPARGRYRQFHQVGVELFGDAGPLVDAEVIDLAVRYLEAAGIPRLAVHLNSLGGPAARSAYEIALKTYLTPHRTSLSADSQRRLELNPLRILDSKDPADQAVVQHAPTLTAFLDDTDRAHFAALQEALARLDIPVVHDPKLVRGLDYYSRTLFEIRATDDTLGAQNAVCGGGRYDALVQSLGGPDCPAVGFAMGLERLLLLQPSQPAPTTPDVFAVAVSPDERPTLLALVQQLRQHGLSVDVDLRGQSLKSQMRRADKSGARLALLLGADEAAASAVQVRDLVAQQSERLAQSGLAAALRARLDAAAASSDTER